MIKPTGLIGRRLGTGRHLFGGPDVMVNCASRHVSTIGDPIGNDLVGDHVLVGISPVANHVVPGDLCRSSRSGRLRRMMMMVGMGLGQ